MLSGTVTMPEEGREAAFDAETARFGGHGPDGICVQHAADGSWTAAVARQDGRVVSFLLVSGPAVLLMTHPDHGRRGWATALIGELAPVMHIPLQQLWSAGGRAVVDRFIADNIDAPWLDKWTCEELGRHRTGCGHGGDNAVEIRNNAPRRPS